MKFTAQQIATLVQGEIEGNANATVSSVAKIEESKEGDLCFLANAKYEEYLYTTKASVVLVNKNLQLKNEVNATLIRVADAYASFALLLQTYQDITSPKAKEGIEEQVQIATSAQLGEVSTLAHFPILEKRPLLVIERVFIRAALLGAK